MGSVPHFSRRDYSQDKLINDGLLYIGGVNNAHQNVHS